MRYAVNLPNGGPAAGPAVLADLAVIAEESGWDAFFLEDYIVYQGRSEVPTYDPWVSLAAIASKTTRIRLGTMVTPVARRRPWKLAREVVTLDHLSQGRVILCVGLGDATTDISFSSFGEELDNRRRAAMLDEALDILVGLWSGQSFDYQGRFFQLKDVTFSPRPVQSPRVPIWVGGAYPNRGPMRRAARWDGVNFYRARALGSAEAAGTLTISEFMDLRRFIESHRELDTPFDFVVHPRSGADSAEEAERLRALEEARATWSQTWIAPAERSVMEAVLSAGPLRAAS